MISADILENVLKSSFYNKTTTYTKKRHAYLCFIRNVDSFAKFKLRRGKQPSPTQIESMPMFVLVSGF